MLKSVANLVFVASVQLLDWAVCLVPFPIWHSYLQLILQFHRTILNIRGEPIHARYCVTRVWIQM